MYMTKKYTKYTDLIDKVSTAKGENVLTPRDVFG